MKKFSKILLGLTALFGVAALAIPAYADDEWQPSDGARTSEQQSGPAAAPSITMQPTNEYVTLKPGEISEKTLTIRNAGSVGYSFRVYAQPYTIDDSTDEYTFSFNTTNAYSTISSWITFADESGEYLPTATYYIEPGTDKEITYRVTSPDSVPAGGQYAAIFAETINDEAETGTINGVYTVSRVALLVYGRSSEGSRTESTISDYKVPSFLLSGPISGSCRVKSSGNIDVTATYKMTVRGIFGNELYANSWSYPVLPETERYVNMTWADTPAFGIYSVDFTVSTADQMEEHTTIVLIYPIWMIVITILLLTGIVIWIIIMLKKRKERKSRLIV